MNRVAVVGALFGIASLLVVPSSRAQILVSRSFETPVTGSGSFTTVSAGQNTLTGWLIESGSVDVENTGYWPAENGLNSRDLDGSNAGTIEQTFSTIIGDQYSVSFAYSNNTGTSAVVGMTSRVFDSASRTLFSDKVTHQGASGSSLASMDYQIGSGFFTADTTSITIQFASTDSSGSDAGIALDNVSVTLTGSGAAPEPSSIGLLATVVTPPCGVVLIRRRLRRA